MDVLLDVEGDVGLRNHLETDNCTWVKSIDPEEIYNRDYPLVKEEETTKKKKHGSHKDFDLEKFEADMGWTKSSSRSYDLTEEIEHMKEEVNPLDKILEKSVIKPDFERLHVIPPYELSKHQLEKRKRRQKRKMGTGAEWFNMKAPEITPEVKHDLEVLQMRSALDPKRFYKKNTIKALPKHFHIGKVIDSPFDYYSRLTKKERKKSIVDELMADAEFKKYNKRKYKEIIEEKKKTHYKAYRHAKRLKQRKRK